MSTKKQNLARLDEIGRSLKKSEHALALIGLGSVGLELDRLDEYSDLDFFVLVEDGYKQTYLENLDWLCSIRSIAFRFMNTADGYKLLFDDGIFCEFAVFELDELVNIPFSEGRIVWKQPWVDGSIAIPQKEVALPGQKPVDWLVGEALTNIFVGLNRLRRGEILSAERFIQHYAVDRVLELISLTAQAQSATRDPFAIERRFELRYPDIAPYLPGFIQGYERSQESAESILDFLEGYFEVDRKMAEAIVQIIKPT